MQTNRTIACFFFATGAVHLFPEGKLVKLLHQPILHPSTFEVRNRNNIFHLSKNKKVTWIALQNSPKSFSTINRFHLLFPIKFRESVMLEQCVWTKIAIWRNIQAMIIGNSNLFFLSYCSFKGCSWSNFALIRWNHSSRYHSIIQSGVLFFYNYNKKKID